jgi:hypothetical protein
MYDIESWRHNFIIIIIIIIIIALQSFVAGLTAFLVS